MIAAGTSRTKASTRYFKFCFRLGSSTLLLFGEIRAIIVMAPKLRAAASPMIRAGISKMPWGSRPASKKPRDFSSATMTEKQDSSKPLKARATIGNRHRMGLNMKLKIRTETFLKKMNIAVVA